MARIQRLSTDVINKIAAGEVIERPASVVKELIENSLDACATRISIRIENGGIKSVWIRDDGCGMDRADASLALERHATSKIRTEEDLANVAFLGFRGEALSSMAAVSRISLQTSCDDSAEGIEIRCEGGSRVSITEKGLPKGTTLLIQDLFFNTPARKKFLRSQGAERSRVVDAVTAQAIAHPEVHFTLHHGNREIFDLPATGDLEERVRQVLGSETAKHLVQCRLQEGRTLIRGLVSLPSFSRRDRKALFLFVNGRSVSDRTIARAVGLAYERILPRGVHPAAILFVEEDPARVDVNVHPAKSEVRFADASRVFGMVQGCIRRAVAFHGNVEPEEAPDLSRSPFELAAAFAARGPGIQEPLVRAAHRVEEAPGTSFTHGHPVSSEQGSERRPCVLGQYRAGYILVEAQDALVLIDQHAAHERILYERFTRARPAGPAPSQGLLVPVVVEFTPSEASWLESVSGELLEMGLEIEPFGGKSFQVRSAPPEVAIEQIPGLLLEIAKGAEAGRPGDPHASLREAVAVSMACHAAVKAGMKLTAEKMDYLVSMLFETQNPLSCPHGRPVLLRLEHTGIERSFGRR